MKIITAWVETQNGDYEMVAAVDEDQYDPAYFEDGVEDASPSYGTEARRLEFEIPNAEIAALFTGCEDADED